MGRIIVTTNLSLDGVMQSPGRPDEDTRDDFTHGGWGQPYSDAVMGQAMGAKMASGGPLVLGRRTYLDLFGFWTKQTDGNPYTDVLNKVQKYVASRTLSEPLPWQNSTLLKGDVVDAVVRLKDESTKDIGVIGSHDLVQTLRRHNLVDEYVLLIYPLVLGAGRRLFEDGYAELQLVESLPTTTGVIIATYRPSA